MKRILIILFYILFIQEADSQSRFQLRPSLGWGQGFISKRKIETNSINSNTYIDFKKYNPYSSSIQKLADRIQYPQIGFMLEYNYTKHSRFGIGYMRGITYARSTTYIDNSLSSYSSGGGIHNKIGIEYTFNSQLDNLIKVNSKYLSRIKFSFLLGGFFINNSLANYDNPLIFVTKDSLGATIDSSISNAETLKYRGFIVSSGIRLGINSKSGKEKYSISIIFDYGFNDLALFKDFTYYNYKNNNIKGYQVSRGNQLKIYISRPINLDRTIKLIASKTY
jgi:hypothetical protein